MAISSRVGIDRSRADMFRSWNSFGILIMTVGYGRVLGVCSRMIVDLSMSRHNWSIVVMVMRRCSMVDLSMSRHYWSIVVMVIRRCSMVYLSMSTMLQLCLLMD